MSKKNRVFSRSQSKQFFSIKLTWTPPYKNNFIFVILNYFYKGGPYSLPTPIHQPEDELSAVGKDLL